MEPKISLSTDLWKDRQTDGNTDRWIDRQMKTQKNGSTYRQMD